MSILSKYLLACSEMCSQKIDLETDTFFCLWRLLYHVIVLVVLQAQKVVEAMQHCLLSVSYGSMLSAIELSMPRPPAKCLERHSY